MNDRNLPEPFGGGEGRTSADVRATGNRTLMLVVTVFIALACYGLYSLAAKLWTVASAAVQG
jgi:hypothetical protein